MGFLDDKGEAEFPFDRDTVFDAMSQAVSSMDRFDVESLDKISGRIVIKTGINLLTFGERIPIQLSAVSDHKTKVQITSSPKGGLWINLSDFGRNNKNIEKILSATSAVLAQHQPATQKKSSTTAPLSESLADELKKLKSLLDEGVLTPEEFKDQKEKLLA